MFGRCICVIILGLLSAVKSQDILHSESVLQPTGDVPKLSSSPVAPEYPWNVTYGTQGKNCIMMSFAGRIKITYNNDKNKEIETGFDVSPNATVNVIKSFCLRDREQVFVLDLDSPYAPDGTLKITFVQNLPKNDSTIYEVELSLRTTEVLFPGLTQAYLNKTVTLSVVNLTLFDTTPEHSYACDALLKTKLEWTSIQVNQTTVEKTKSPFQSGTFETSHLKVQAFLPGDTKTNTVKFLPEILCSDDKDIPTAVPITVGIVLLVMMAGVLVAFFINRNRQNN